MTIPKLDTLFETSEKAKDFGKPIKDRFADRQSEQLALAFCGPVGSNIPDVRDVVTEILKNYNYEVQVIKISDLIKDNAERVGIDLSEDKLKEASRYLELQTAGNTLRQKFDPTILGQLAIKSIIFDRLSRIKKAKKIEGEFPVEELKTSHRVAYLIDSLKHPAEVEILRTVYRNLFYLIGILCVEDVREDRLRQQKIAPEDVTRIIERDKNESLEYGQKLIKTLQFADYFITNNKENPANVKPQLTRFFDLIFGTKIITPTKHEYAMYMAQSAAASSACLSRQIGAVIINQNEDIISSGCNDVPKAFGGLYTVEDGGDDARCAVNGKYCRSDKYKEEMEKDIQQILYKELSEMPGLKKSKKVDLSATILELSRKISHSTRLKDLIEFSRAVHAEMEAIISAARTGVSIKGGTLYTTTFPCHNCARHIIAAGITKVYYIEPYEKSLAFDLHKDSIILEPFLKEGTDQNKVVFAHFEGIAPRQYLNLFQSKNDRKKDGQTIEKDPRKVKPVIHEYSESWIEFEYKIIEDLKKLGFNVET